MATSLTYSESQLQSLQKDGRVTESKAALKSRRIRIKNETCISRAVLFFKQELNK